MAPIQRTQNAKTFKDDYDDNVRICVATQEHKEGIIRLMREEFLPREPVEVALGTTWEEARESLIYETDVCIGQPYSFVAVHPTEGVIGCRMSKFIQVDPAHEEINDMVAAIGDAPSLRIFQIVTNRLMNGYLADLANRGFRTAFQFVNMCVDERFAGRGIAKLMVEASSRMAERLRADCLFALATNRISQRVLQKSGFAPWRSLIYAECIDEDTGKPYVIPQDGTQQLQWMVKVLGPREAASG